MNPLFTATLIVQGQSEAYDVTFEHDHYTFLAQEKNINPVSFKVFREEDEWHVKDSIPDILKQQAISQLEYYLLQQH
ncbi:MAG: hypothetical protein M3342_02700 [Bacteroidota bacterium]|nr:hypothetical protein [Flavisolibacter sp.]MDQ3842912.1 hypothetical protein [Bacteroidota bacterium]MBD0284945.1 hypothetical protein [Flavisolibacter sp.]MBD0294220.1 hypothetical protein [Flavisolibacter sp.]MBD0350278.1 hypothetical protein [Flavisolibacter sp.]